MKKILDKLFSRKADIREESAKSALIHANKLLRNREFEAAITAFEEIVTIDKESFEAHKNMGNALMSLGRIEQAKNAYLQSIDINPDYYEGNLNYGNALCALSQSKLAIQAYQKTLKITPQCYDSWAGIGNANMQLNNYQDALAAYTNATNIAPKNPKLLYNLGLCHIHSQQFNDAIKSLTAAIEAINNEENNKPVFWNDLQISAGLAHSHLQQHAAAIDCFQQVIAISPNAQAYYYLGMSLANINDFGAALPALNSAIECQADMLPAYIRKAELLEFSNLLDEARETVNQALELDPGHPALKLIDAKLKFREKDLSTAYQVMKGIDSAQLEINLQTDYYHLMGKICDRIDKFNEAFDSFSKCNSLKSQQPRSVNSDEQEPIEYIDTHLKVVSPEWVSSWVTSVSPAKNPPTFLVGFPRSGTTLLGQMLLGHKNIALLEEEIVIKRVIYESSETQQNYPQCISRLTEADIDTLRENYFKIAAEHVEINNDMTLVDKLPMHTTNLAFIYRLFPNAKIIFALRHSCDVALSCFMQNFELNNTMLHFLDLEKTAIIYDKVMQLYCKYRESLPLDIMEVKYEKIVADYEEQTKQIIEFLELPWDENVLHYTETARQSGFINTPSYQSVTEKIYQHAKYRWKHYETQLEPVMPLLNPWIKKYDY